MGLSHGINGSVFIAPVIKECNCFSVILKEIILFQDIMKGLCSLISYV